MVGVLEAPGLSAGSHEFDSSECRVPGCPGPQRNSDGVLVCGNNTPEATSLEGSLGFSGIVNCAVNGLSGHVVERDKIDTPPDVIDGTPEGDGNKDLTEEPDIYVA